MGYQPWLGPENPENIRVTGTSARPLWDMYVPLNGFKMYSNDLDVIGSSILPGYMIANVLHFSHTKEEKGDEKDKDKVIHIWNLQTMIHLWNTQKEVYYAIKYLWNTKYKYQWDTCITPVKTELTEEKLLNKDTSIIILSDDTAMMTIEEQ